MGNYNSVTVSENTNQENISLEQQAAMQDEAAKENGLTVESEQPEETSERPEWLDEKFDSPEDLAKAYQELQQKQSTQENASEEENSTEETAPETNNVVATATAEFAETGQLSDETFLSLEKAGIPRDIVESYMRGQESISVAAATEIQNSIGGVENYKAMSEWAGNTLSDEELAAYNTIVETGTVDQARVAVKGMYAQFASQGGKTPSLSQGSTSGDGGTRSFGSAAAMVEAMADPRYKNDPAYRKQVEKRLAVSNAF